MGKKRIASITFLCICCVMLIIPAININIKSDAVLIADNRTLVNFPDVDDQFVDGLNAYVNDRIGFREEALVTYQVAEDKLFHHLVHPLYQYGKENWIMTNEWDSIQTFHLDLEVDFARRFAAFMKSAESISAEYDAKFLFVLIPNKETVYPEYLAKGYNINDQESKSDKIVAELRKQKVPYIPLSKIY